LAVFEAPLDALSHASFQLREGWQWNGHRLSLGGTSSVALIAFLEHNPQIRRVMLHLDNDAAGITAARKIKTELAVDSRFRHIRVSVNPPRGGKDYNDALLRAVSLEREQKTHRRQEAAISL
jgi:DNA primase